MIRRCGLSLPLSAMFAVLFACGREPAPSADPPLETLDAAALDRLLEKHRDDVVLVDFWATWCGPCVEFLPHTVEMHDRHGDRGLVVVTVSLDDLEQAPAVRRLLARLGSTTRNHIAPYGVGPKAFSAFGIDDGAIPHLRLYDRRNRLRRTFSAQDAADRREIERQVIRLLDEAG